MIVLWLKYIDNHFVFLSKQMNLVLIFGRKVSIDARSPMQLSCLSTFISPYFSKNMKLVLTLACLYSNLCAFATIMFLRFYAFVFISRSTTSPCYTCLSFVAFSLQLWWRMHVELNPIVWSKTWSKSKIHFGSLRLLHLRVFVSYDFGIMIKYIFNLI